MPLRLLVDNTPRAGQKFSLKLSWKKVHLLLGVLKHYMYHCINYSTKSFVKIMLQKFETDVMYRSKDFATIA